jgi:hypothetical protein
LERAVFFNRLGEIRDRSFERQRYRTSGLNLVVAAIVLWNTVYLGRAIQRSRMAARSSTRPYSRSGALACGAHDGTFSGAAASRDSAAVEPASNASRTSSGAGRDPSRDGSQRERSGSGARRWAMLNSKGRPPHLNHALRPAVCIRLSHRSFGLSRQARTNPHERDAL